MLLSLILVHIAQGTQQLDRINCDLYKYYTQEGCSISDFAKFHEQIELVQSGKFLLFVNKTLEENLPNILNPTANSLYCQRTYAHPKKDVVFSICQLYGVQPFVQAYKCQDQGCSQLGELQELLRSRDGYNKMMIVEDSMIVLAADRYYFSNINYGRIDIYKVNLNDTWFSVSLSNYIIDSFFFDSYQNPIYMSDFDIEIQQMKEEDIYKMYIADRANGLLWIDFVLRNGQLIPGAKGRIDLKSLVYADSTTQFMQVRFLSKSVIQDNTVQTELLITTNNKEHYILNLVFKDYEYQNVYIKQTLSRLANYKAQNTLQIYKDWIAISYSNLNNEFGISIYNRQRNDNQLTLNIQDTIYFNYQEYLAYYFDEIDSQVVINYRSGRNTITQCKVY